MICGLLYIVIFLAGCAKFLHGKPYIHFYYNAFNTRIFTTRHSAIE